jgi:hypothetical protein
MILQKKYRHGLQCVCICIYMIQDVLISQITSSSSASDSYSAQMVTRSNLNQGDRQPPSPVTSPSHLPEGWHIYGPQTPTRSDAAEAAPRYAADVQADPVSFATPHPTPTEKYSLRAPGVPASVDAYRQGREVRVLGNATAEDYGLQRVPQVAASGPPIMQPMMQQPMSMMQQMPHAPDSGTNMPGPPREPTVSAKEQALIDYWK